MLKNYIKVALRNLLRYKVYSIVNVVGLALGITCTVLLALFVQHELSYDNYFPDADRIYRVAGKFKLGDQEYNFAVCPPILAKTVLDELPEVVKTARFRAQGSKIVRHNNVSFSEEHITFADNSVIDMFGINLSSGNPETALIEPNFIIISEKAAKKYFGSENGIGKILTINNQRDYKVTGVFKGIPDNTHFRVDFLQSMLSLEEAKQETWLSNNFQTYLLLEENTDPLVVNKKLDKLTETYLGPEIEKVMGISLEQLAEQGGGGGFYLQAVRQIHLKSDLMSELGVNSDIKYVYIFSVIAIFIMIIACVNFMNISTARSATRSKEVGIRKVLGSHRKGLRRQFLVESFVTTVISMIISIGLIELIIPYFNTLTGKQLSIQYMHNPFVLIMMVMILIVIGFLAGSYPAFVLSGFNPIEALRGRTNSNKTTGSLRSGLVIFQFTASIVLIISTIVVLNQLRYIQNKKLGFNKENVITLDYAHLLGDKTQIFKEKMLNHPEIINATVSNFLPVPSGYNSSMIFPAGKVEEGVSIQLWDVDHDYLSTMKMKIIEGRDFSKEFSTDSAAVILNQAAVKVFGLENPVGEVFCRYYNPQGDFNNYNVIGVVEDFHFESLRNNISPLAIFIGESNGTISFRVNTADVSMVIDKLKETWNELAPGQPFNYSFLDERFNSMYKGEQRISEIFGTFAALAIFIGCLGLFSLSAFTAEQKTKEIGIRKVLGSSLTSIVLMLSKEFVKLVLIAFIIASPIAFYFMDKWLADFEYRTDLSIWVFVSAGLISLIIAIITVSYHALRAASANPINSLKYE